jgi:type IV pilus assembly protein PilE
MRRERGFSLIELMIVVLIIGILAAVAINSYRKYVIRARRTDALTAMQDLAGREERFFYGNSAYTTVLTSLNITATFGGPYYVVAPASATSTAYTITATPTALQVDPECKTLTLTSTGVYSTNGTGTAATCWGR